MFNSNSPFAQLIINCYKDIHPLLSFACHLKSFLVSLIFKTKTSMYI